MGTGDKLPIAQEAGRRPGPGDDVYPPLPKVVKDGLEAGSRFDTLDEMTNADGFARVFLEYKYEIVKRLQGLGRLCAMTDDGVIAVEGATDAIRGAADTVLTEP